MASTRTVTAPRTSPVTTISISRETWLRLQAIGTPFRGSELGTPEKVIEHLLDAYEEDNAPPEGVPNG